MISPLFSVLFSLSILPSVSSATSFRYQRDSRHPSRSIPFQAHSSGIRTTIVSRDDNGGTMINLTNLVDLAYLGQVSVGGQKLSLDIDTGSSDLWVKVPVMTTNRTNVEVNLTYGVGSAAGQLAFSPTCIGAYCVPEQILLDVDSMTAPDNQAKTGLIGLGFPNLSLLYKAANTSNITANALPPIYNIFNQHSNLSRLIGLALERSDDKEQTTGGHLTIGEYHPDFVDVEKSEKHTLSPADTSRWTIPINGISMNGQTFDNLTSAGPEAATNTPVALIDSGTSLAYIPQAAVDFIYGNIPGSVRYKDGLHGWMVPCTQPANLTFTFGGETFSIDPLEITQIQTMTHEGREWSFCVNTFNPQVDPYGPGLDYVLGDIFMRNVYSVFNYGDLSSTYNPAGSGASIQFLSRTNQTEAMQKFAAQRNETLKSLPPLLDIRKMDSSGNWSTRSFDS